MALTGGHGFDDIFVFVPNEQLITMASSLLAPDGCLNFFAGPQDKQFSAPINFYDVHYAFTHYVGTSGGNTDDMRAAVALMQAKKVQAAKVVTHILGLNAVVKQPSICRPSAVVKSWCIPKIASPYPSWRYC